MRKILNILYTTALVIALSYNLFAGIYVSSGGSNTSPYDTWAKATSSFSSAQGVASAGDTIFISGGADSVVYSSGLSITVSGSWNNYIYFMAGKYSPSPSGHSGKPIIDLAGGGTQGINITSQSWVYVKGITVRETAANGILIYLTSRHIVIDSCDVSNNGGFGIYGNGASCSGTGQNMAAWDSTDVVMDITIKNCNIRSFRDEWPNTDDLIQFTCARDIKIHDNFILNNNLQTERGASEHIHQDDIQTFNVQGLKIYNNVLVIDSAAMGHNLIISCQSRDGSEYSGVDECIVYNNMIYHGGHLVASGYPATQHLFLRWYGGATMAPTYIFHNTFVWANGSGGAIEQQRKAILKNNIFYHDGTWGSNPSVYGGTDLGFWQSGGTYQGDFTTQVDSCQGNLFWYRWTTDNEIPFTDYLSNFVGAGGSPSTGAPSGWADWSTTWGGNGVHANPLFTDTLWVEGYQDIASNSPAIDSGKQSAWIEAFLEARDLPITDFYGNPRDTYWDIGAMEYQQGIADTIPTFSFTPVTGAELTTEYIASSAFTNADSTFSVWTTTGADFKINFNGTYSAAQKTADQTDTVFVKNTSSGSNSTLTTETIVAGGVSQNFNVTTKAASAIIQKVLPGN